MKSTEERKESVLKAKELSEDELTHVIGGLTDNGNGTYNVNIDDYFFPGSGCSAFSADRAYVNVTLDTYIEVIKYRKNGQIYETETKTTKALGYLLGFPGY